MIVGQELEGRYRILGKLGAGGMGEVYLAEHIALHRREALKILRAEWAETPESLARFRREARVTNRLQHPNIIGVYDFGQLPDGRFYLATEYAEGKNIGELLAKGPFVPHRVVRILVQLADAMAHAHERGVVHRDLKPENLMLVSQRGHTDVLKVLDFGIAKITSADYNDSVKTEKSAFYGTPEYVAPERMQDDADAPSVDIYAVGCIGYEMLTGMPPFRGRPMEVLHHHVSTPAPAPSASCEPDAISEELDAVILRCLAKKPEDRFPDADSLGAALRDLAAYHRVTPISSPLPRSGTYSDSTRPRPNVAPATSGSTTRPKPKGKQRSEGDDATEIPGTERPDSVPWFGSDLPPAPEALQALYEASVTLGEALVDAGCNEISLIIGLAAVASAEDDLIALLAQLEDLDKRSAEVEQRARKREASLRFALGELRFEKEQRKKRNEPPKKALSSEIRVLAKRLAQVHEKSKKAIAELEEESIRLAALRDDLEVQRADSHAPLRRTVSRLAPDFAETEGIPELIAALKAALKDAGDPL